MAEEMADNGKSVPDNLSESHQTTPQSPYLSIAVNNGQSVQCYPKQSVLLPFGTAKRVIMTPLTSPQSSASFTPSVSSMQSINKLLIKSFVKGSKKDFKIFTLRNINLAVTTSREKLEREIRQQLRDELCVDSFDIGYFQQGRRKQISVGGASN